MKEKTSQAELANTSIYDMGADLTILFNELEATEQANKRKAQKVNERRIASKTAVRTLMNTEKILFRVIKITVKAYKIFS